MVLVAYDICLGAKIRGEGLIELTRALQHAGARCMADASTKEWMVTFRRGAPHLHAAWRKFVLTQLLETHRMEPT